MSSEVFPNDIEGYTENPNYSRNMNNLESNPINNDISLEIHNIPTISSEKEKNNVNQKEIEGNSGIEGNNEIEGKVQYRTPKGDDTEVEKKMNTIEGGEIYTRNDGQETNEEEIYGNSSGVENISNIGKVGEEKIEKSENEGNDKIHIPGGTLEQHPIEQNRSCNERNEKSEIEHGKKRESKFTFNHLSNEEAEPLGEHKRITPTTSNFQSSSPTTFIPSESTKVIPTAWVDPQFSRNTSISKKMRESSSLGSIKKDKNNHIESYRLNTTNQVLNQEESLHLENRNQSKEPLHSNDEKKSIPSHSLVHTSDKNDNISTSATNLAIQSNDISETMKTNNHNSIKQNEYIQSKSEAIENSTRENYGIVSNMNSALLPSPMQNSSISPISTSPHSNNTQILVSNAQQEFQNNYFGKLDIVDESKRFTDNKSEKNLDNPAESQVGKVDQILRAFSSAKIEGGIATQRSGENHPIGKNEETSGTYTVAGNASSVNIIGASSTGSSGTTDSVVSSLPNMSRSSDSAGVANSPSTNLLPNVSKQNFHISKNPLNIANPNVQLITQQLNFPLSPHLTSSPVSQVNGQGGVQVHSPIFPQGNSPVPQINPQGNPHWIQRNDIWKLKQLSQIALKLSPTPSTESETSTGKEISKMEDDNDESKKSDYDEQLEIEKDEYENSEFEKAESEKSDPRYIVEMNPHNMNIKLKHKTRLEPFQNYFPEKVYMPIIYQISLKVLSMQNFAHSAMFVRFAVVSADNSNFIISRKMRSKNVISDSSEETILAGEREGTIVRDNDFNGYENSEYSICYKGLFKIKFSDSSFYYDQKDFRLRVSIFDQSDLNKEICRILSRPFKIFARKPSKEASTLNPPRLKFMKESRKRKAAESDFQPPTIEIRNRPVKLRKLRYQDHASPISAMVDETLTTKVRDLISYISNIQDTDKRKYAQKISLQSIYEIDDQNGVIIAKSLLGESITPH